MKIKTEFNFVLPEGTNEKGQKIRGAMRLLKVKDLIDVYRDARVKETTAYFYVVLLGRVITKLGTDTMVHAKMIENLSTENFAFLVDFLNEINHKVLRTFPVRCASCDTVYTGEVSLVGEQ